MSSSARIFSSLILVTTAIVLTALLNCAETGLPPGGEEDKVKPFILGSEPANGSLNVSSENRILIYFSETVIPPVAGASVFVSPQPASKPKLKWKSDRLEIIFEDSFKADQTYVVSVGALADLRGNKLDSAGVIAFSTGAALDSGAIGGMVKAEDKPKAGVFVALYDEADLADSCVYDSLVPAYLTRTNGEGVFTLDYLPRRSFRLIAFEDKNHDGFFNPHREAFAVTDRAIVVGGEAPLNNLLLSLTTLDTLRPEILSATYTSERLLRVRLSRKIKIDWLHDHPERVLVKSSTDTSAISKAHSILEKRNEESSILTLALPNLAAGDYILQVQTDSGFEPLIYPELVVEDREDKTAPQLESFTPGRSPRFASEVEIRMIFSEPLDTTALSSETFLLWQEPEQLIDLEWYWEDSFRLRFLSPEISAGHNYRLVVTDFELRDRAGNALGDSLSEHRFVTIDDDSLGSISGLISRLIPGQEEQPVILKFLKVGEKSPMTMTVEGEQFRFEVPSGDYLLTALLDRNGDGQAGVGSACPFGFAETQADYPDTISVRARFETTGIVFEIK